ncbi:MAG: hypothetical protein FWB76_02800 [Oscillospiraceae bacterium]|nr:hypothetical protein [Oscillospiraceae bacterium]
MANAASYELLMSKLANVNIELGDIFNLITQSPPVYINSVDPAFTGVGVGIIRTGNSYNIWGTGSFSSTRSFSGGTTYYLIKTGRADAYAPLTWYQGPPTVFTVWLQSNNDLAQPLYFDNTGIYMTPHNNLSNITGTFAFTATLMLAAG